MALAGRAVSAAALGLQAEQRVGVALVRLVAPDARGGGGVEHGATGTLLLSGADGSVSSAVTGRRPKVKGCYGCGWGDSAFGLTDATEHWVQLHAKDGNDGDFRLATCFIIVLKFHRNGSRYRVSTYS